MDYFSPPINTTKILLPQIFHLFGALGDVILGEIWGVMTRLLKSRGRGCEYKIKTGVRRC
jgi:hypothetical protein